MLRKILEPYTVTWLWPYTVTLPYIYYYSREERFFFHYCLKITLYSFCNKYYSENAHNCPYIRIWEGGVILSLSRKFSFTMVYFIWPSKAITITYMQAPRYIFIQAAKGWENLKPVPWIRNIEKTYL